jgi:hypothetical protein
MKPELVLPSNSRLVAFIYLLGRDKLPLGAIEDLVVHLEKEKVRGTKLLFSNVELAEYAQRVVARLEKLTAEAGT